MYCLAPIAKVGRVLHLDEPPETSRQHVAQLRAAVRWQRDHQLIDREALHELIEPGDRPEKWAIDRIEKVAAVVGIADDLIASVFQLAGRLLPGYVGADDDRPSSWSGRADEGRVATPEPGVPNCDGCDRGGPAPREPCSGVERLAEDDR